MSLEDLLLPVIEMEGIKLSELEQAYYNELFQTCDVEGTSKITAIKASELFLASNLPQEALKQIWELCGAKRLGHFGRSQFYIALKLIAVAQSNFPLKLETLNTGIEIPLPRFTSKSNDQGDRKRGAVEGDIYVVDGKGPSSGSLPPPPNTKQHRRSLSGQYRGVVPDNPASFNSSPQQSLPADDSPHNSHKSPPPPKSPPTSPNHNPRGNMQRQHTAPAAYAGTIMTMDVVHDAGHVNPLALASNNVGGGGGPGGGGGIVNPAMPTVAMGNGPSAPPLSSSFQNLSNENGNWAMFEDDESHMLIGGGTKKYDSSVEPAGVDSSSISSEAESVDDVYTITDEQREYYIKQFLSMQPDLNKHITGPVAKNFFEKSKLPVSELSKIWNLSDLNRDGALSMEEFCIAMHLVVLRRNDIELPDRLPLSLMPYSTLSDEPFAADLPPGSTLKRATPPSPVENKWKANFVPDSPGSSGVPSPAHLVNFDYAKPSADPDSKIVHPVAVRASPDSLHMPSEGFERGRALSDSAVPPSHEMAEDLCGGTEGLLHPRPPPSISPPPPPSNLPPCDSPGSGTKFSASIAGPLQSRPRPIPKKPSTVAVVTRGQLQPPPPSGQPGEEGGAAPGVSGGGDPAAASVPPTQGPPTPPPRPQMHGRSMSVDMRAGCSVLPPAVPPRVQPKEAHIFHKASEPGATAESAISSSEPLLVESSGGGSAAGPPLEHVEVGSGEDVTENSVKEKSSHMSAAAHRQMSRDKRDIGMAIRTHKERNAMLTRLNSELNQELQEVMEQRIALEIQLEHLKPFYS